MSTPTRPRRAWLGLAVLALPCMITVMDLTVLNLAVPRLTEALNPSGTQLLWIVDIYGFMLAGALIPIGGLGDRIGRRKLLLIGAAAFGTASALAAFSTSALMLIGVFAKPLGIPSDFESVPILASIVFIYLGYRVSRKAKESGQIPASSNSQKGRNAKSCSRSALDKAETMHEVWSVAFVDLRRRGARLKKFGSTGIKLSEP